MLDANEQVVSCDVKNSGHTRSWCNDRNRRDCEPDDGRRAMASWLSRRSLIGGLAAGAILGAALAAPRPYYFYAYEPVFFGPRCYVRRERYWDGWGRHFRCVEDCY
jgi:hypothetical protein